MRKKKKSDAEGRRERERGEERRRERERERERERGGREAYAIINITLEAYITPYEKIRSLERSSVAKRTSNMQCCHICVTP